MRHATDGNHEGDTGTHSHTAYATVSCYGVGVFPTVTVMHTRSVSVVSKIKQYYEILLMLDVTTDGGWSLIQYYVWRTKTIWWRCNTL